MDIHQNVKPVSGGTVTAKSPAKIPSHLATAARYPVANLEVRNQASRAIRSPRQALAFATYRLAISRTKNERELALAGVDVVVTGRKAYAAFIKEPELLDRDILGALPDGFRDRVDPATMATALAQVRARLAETRRFVESDGSGTRKRPGAGGSEWVSVAPETDRPWVPLNVGASSFGWKRITTGKGLDVRYVATGDLSSKKSRVIIYLHGLGSRGEECVNLGKELSKLGDYVVVGPDLPGHGYTEPVPVGGRLDYADRIDQPFDASERYLFLTCLDEFLDDFVTSLIAAHPGLDKRLAGIAGGSLGGNLALRATLRQTAFPLRSITSWSAGSVWAPFATDPFQKLAANATLTEATMDEHLDTEPDHWISSTARDAYLDRTFVQQIALEIGGKKLMARGPEMWWRKSLPDFKEREANSYADRVEVYDENFRRWQARLAYEQLLFSHREAGRPKRLCGASGDIPALLLAGSADNFYFANIYDRMLDVATGLRGRSVKGSCFLLADTGHSIHDERPKELATRMHEFIGAHVP